MNHFNVMTAGWNYSSFSEDELKVHIQEIKKELIKLEKQLINQIIDFGYDGHENEKYFSKQKRLYDNLDRASHALRGEL